MDFQTYKPGRYTFSYKGTYDNSPRLRDLYVMEDKGDRLSVIDMALHSIPEPAIRDMIAKEDWKSLGKYCRTLLKECIQ